MLDAPPPPEFAIEFVNKVGLSSRDSSRVEVPFAHVAPPEAEVWSEDTASELRVPIGRTGATKFQYLAIGKGTCQHGLIAGKTGSGKSTLFHVIITNLALWCSPEQVEFYLVDFKKGVEFKCYATHRLPHARVVAIESDREFGLSVLQRVDDELKHRGDLFRQLGVQDVAGYKRAGGTEPIPRSLLIIDEFQEFFVEDDRISQTASLLLDRLVRQGRAFGIHVLLGSQTLGRRLHRRPHHARPDGHPHRPAVQRGGRLPDHGREQPRAAAAVAARRGHLQRHGGHDRRQQPVPGGLAAGPGAGDVSGEGPGEGGRGGSPKSKV